MSDPPQSPADPRPGGEPYYIDNDCPECGTALVLADDTEPVWHDEWVCPQCDDGILMDWPAEYREEILGTPQDAPVADGELSEASEAIQDLREDVRADLAEDLGGAPDDYCFGERHDTVSADEARERLGLGEDEDEDQ